VLKDLGGDTVLARVIDRVRRASEIEEVVIATTRQPDDDRIGDECRRLARGYRGETNDVLTAITASEEVRAGDCRITSDCPLIGPEITDATSALLERRPDYASNVLREPTLGVSTRRS
jgi:spore coat polysaccharide biosynthesis protein SpsF